MNKTIIDNCNRRVGPSDRLFILGGFVFGPLDEGRYIDNSADDVDDLICECVPDILDKYMDKDITQKEFIQQHIDYYKKVKNESVVN